MHVRPFDLETDLQACLSMTRAVYDTGIYRDLSFDAGKALNLMLVANQDPDYFFHVAEINSCLVGYMAAQLGEHYCSTDLYSCDIVLWVNPEHRGSPAAKLLVTAYREWAQIRGVVLSLIGNMIEDDPVVDAFFDHLPNATRIGKNYLLR